MFFGVCLLIFFKGGVSLFVFSFCCFFFVGSFCLGFFFGGGVVVFLVFVHFFKLMNLNRISKIDGHGVRKMETGKKYKRRADNRLHKKSAEFKCLK